MKRVSHAALRDWLERQIRPCIRLGKKSVKADQAAYARFDEEAPAITALEDEVKQTQLDGYLPGAELSGRFVGRSKDFVMLSLTNQEATLNEGGADRGRSASSP